MSGIYEEVEIEDMKYDEVCAITDTMIMPTDHCHDDIDNCRRVKLIHFLALVETIFQSLWKTYMMKRYVFLCSFPFASPQVRLGIFDFVCVLTTRTLLAVPAVLSGFE